MSKICFETQIEVGEIREALDYSIMALKLKGDPQTQHMTGLKMCFQALTRCELILNALHSQPSTDGRDIERFQSLLSEARTQVSQYHKEFNLMIVNAAPTVQPPPAPKVKQTANASDAHKKLTTGDVRRIKQQLASVGRTICFEDVRIVAQDYPHISVSAIREIAIGNNWAEVPWPNGNAPQYIKGS